jgi:hypothetical protein
VQTTEYRNKLKKDHKSGKVEGTTKYAKYTKRISRGTTEYTEYTEKRQESCPGRAGAQVYDVLLRVCHAGVGPDFDHQGVDFRLVYF